MGKAENHSGLSRSTAISHKRVVRVYWYKRFITFSKRGIVLRQRIKFFIFFFHLVEFLQSILIENYE